MASSVHIHLNWYHLPSFHITSNEHPRLWPINKSGPCLEGNEDNYFSNKLPVNEMRLQIINYIVSHVVTNNNTMLN